MVHRGHAEVEACVLLDVRVKEHGALGVDAKAPVVVIDRFLVCEIHRAEEQLVSISGEQAVEPHEDHPRFSANLPVGVLDRVLEIVRYFSVELVHKLVRVHEEDQQDILCHVDSYVLVFI